MRAPRLSGCFESDYRDTVLALVSRCSSDTFEWISGPVFGTRPSITPAFPLTVALAGARSSGHAVCLACNPVASLRPGGRSAAPCIMPGEAAHFRLAYFAPSAFPPCGFKRFRVSGRTSPVSRPLRAHERSWRASRHLSVLAAVFRIALRSRPTAPLVAARVPLREAIAVFGPVFRPCPSLGRSPGSALGPALATGAMGSPPLLFAGFLPHRISLAARDDLTD